MELLFARGPTALMLCGTPLTNSYLPDQADGGPTAPRLRGTPPPTCRPQANRGTEDSQWTEP